MSAVVAVFVVCVACCVIGHAAILRSVIRSRVVPADASVRRPRLAVEIVWAVIPAIALAILLTATWARVRANDVPTPGVLMKLVQ